MTTYVLGHFSDLHVSEIPVAEQRLVRAEARFLFEEEKYNEIQRLNASLPLGEFRVIPLALRAKHDYVLRSHLATQYPRADAAGDSSWRLQFPFEFKLPSSRCRLIAEAPDIDSGVEVSIFVWPTGWSSNVSISLARALSLRDLLSLSEQLRAGQVLHVGSKRFTLTGLFRYLHEKLIETVFLKPDSVLIPPAMPRNSVWLLSSTAERFEPWDDLDSEDKTLIHSILRGKQLDLTTRIRIERREQYLRLPLSEDGFALVEFDHGALLSIAGPKTKRWRNKIQCLASNVGRISWLGLALAKTSRFETEALEALRSGASLALSRLPETYSNIVAQSILRHHGGIRGSASAG